MSECDIKASTVIEVPFYDVDVMEVAWHGHYVKYFEQARCALLDAIDYNYTQMKESGYAWPVVELKVKYIKPLHFKQIVQVIATLVEYENRMKIRYEVLDKESEQRLCKGETVQLAIDMKTESLCFVTPTIFQQKVIAYQEESHA